MDEAAFETLSMLCGHVQHRLSDTPAMDIYALGLVFWQMASWGTKPCRPDELPAQEYKNFLLNENLAHTREVIPADCPEAFRELILRCWSYDPAQRPSAPIGGMLRFLPFDAKLSETCMDTGFQAVFTESFRGDTSLFYL